MSSPTPATVLHAASRAVDATIMVPMSLRMVLLLWSARPPRLNLPHSSLFRTHIDRQLSKIFRPACDTSPMMRSRANDRRGRSRSEAPRLVGLDGGPALPERRPARRDVRLSCQVIVGSDCTHEAVLEDVSYRGFKVRSPISLL